MPSAKCPSCGRDVSRPNRRTTRSLDQQGREDSVVIYACPGIQCGAILGVAPDPDELVQDLADKIRLLLHR